MTSFVNDIIKNSPEASEFVFPNPKTGKPYTDIKKTWHAACRRAGIKNLRFHYLRHTFCTCMAAAGVNTSIIVAIAGHKDTGTAKRFINPTDENLLYAMAKMSEKYLQQSGF